MFVNKKIVFLSVLLYNIVKVFGSDALKKKKKLFSLLLIIALIASLWYFNNYSLRLTEQTIYSDKVKNDVKIALVSDLHGVKFGKNNRKISELVKAQSPDLIFVLGDMYTQNHTEQIDTAVSLIAELSQFADTYIITGDHDTDQVYKDKINELKTFYCREDFEYQLSRVDNAAPDSVLFCKSDLEELCKAKEIDTDELINDRDRSLLKKIPTRVEMKEELLQFFYDMYKKIPTTQQVMERIVRTLAPEYNNDEIRVAILKKFVSGAGDDFKCFDTNSIIQWVKNKLNDSEKKKMESLDEKGQKRFLISKINNDIFDDFDKLEDKELSQDDALTPKEILSLIIRFSEKHSEVKERIGEKILKIQEEMEDINLELVTSKEKDFRKELKQINTGIVKKNGKPQTYNDVYTQAKKDAKKKKRRVREKNSINVDTKLLKLCNDLANGIFRTKGTTKKYLYYFALMFEMNFSLTKPEDRDKTDIRNMFQDYYNDNLLRFLKDGEKEKAKEKCHKKICYIWNKVWIYR